MIMNRPISPWLWYVMAIPFVYLAAIYGDLPDQIPIHYNLRGEADGWGSKAVLWLLPVMGPLLTMLIMTRFIPLVDFEGKLEKMGTKYDQLSLGVVGTMSLLMTYFIYNAGNEQLGNVNLLFVLLALMYSVFGNYLGTIKPNQLMGFRTPWTMSNAHNGRQTHRFGGRLWFFGGFAIAALVFFLPRLAGMIFFGAATLLLCLLPVGYSYRMHRRGDGEELL